MRDYTAITELPGGLLTAEQATRFRHRYALAARLARGPHLLEVACGAGAGLGLWLDHPAVRAVGLDVTEGVLRTAQAHLGKSLPLVRGSAEQLPFAAAAFDTLLCFEAIYYLADIPGFLREAHRLLAPGGLLLLCQTNPSAPGFVPGLHTTIYPPAPELASMLQAAGFGVVHLYGAFPHAQATPRQRAVRSARRWAHDAGVLPRNGALADALKRLSYGAMTPLPALLHPQELERDPDLTPLAPHRPNLQHRVLYACAER